MVRRSGKLRCRYPDPDLPPTSIAEPRIQALVQRLGEELRGRTRTEWERILAEASQRTGVEFSLFDGTLHPVAGPLAELPAELEGGIRRN